MEIAADLDSFSSFTQTHSRINPAVLNYKDGMLMLCYVMQTSYLARQYNSPLDDTVVTVQQLQQKLNF